MLTDSASDPTGALAAPDSLSLVIGRRLAAQHQVDAREVLMALRAVEREMPDAALVLDAAARLIVVLMTREQLALVELQAQHRGAARRILAEPIRITNGG